MAVTATTDGRFDLMHHVTPAASPAGGDHAPAPATGHPPPPMAHIPTGAKLFLILSGALLPLALIAIFATLQTTRVADSETRARLRVASSESARALAIELVGDMTALRVAMNALGTDPGDAASCARAQGVFIQQSSSGARFAITDRRGRVVCGDTGPFPAPAQQTDAPIDAAILPGKAPGSGLVLSMENKTGHTTARAYFPQDFLARIARPTSHALIFSSALVYGDRSLPLEDPAEPRAFRRIDTMRVDLGLGGLALHTTIARAPITSSLVIALLLPLLMWAAAAGIGWFVVDRLLIRPLRQLRKGVASYTPGEVIDPGTFRALPAQEIRELGDTFRAISRTVALHEAGLAEGLVRQTKLTREVHHRVKNNLQVIASLINFHARGAASEEASAAYASIQRRVDALAVVHRNHFAELEENRGLNLRPMLGELAANIRATAPETSHDLAITLDVQPFLVSQDVAVAAAFLVTELIELAMTCNAIAQIRVSLQPTEREDRAKLRIVSGALVESERLRAVVQARYQRVIEGLSRQLRSPLHHDPLSGAYEIDIAVLGRD